MNKLIFNLKNEINEVEKLKKRQFAIPKLDWENKVPFLVGKNTLAQMITNMSKYGFENIIKSVRKKINEEITVSSIELLIEKEIKNYLENQSTEKLIFIFHLIQIWGGNTGRMFYFKGAKVDFIEYKNLITSVLKFSSPTEIISELKNFVNSKNTKYLNIAFATKHISLWQRFGTEFKNPLPIYDSIIAKNIMGVVTHNRKKNSWSGFTNNDWISLELYWENMINVSQMENTSTATIERQIFNFFRDKDWRRNYSR